MSTSRPDATFTISHPASQDAPILGHGVFGQGSEKVLVFHDWMGDSANHEPLIPYLGPSTHTYVFADVRAYGKSRHLTGAYSVDEVAADAFLTSPRMSTRRRSEPLSS